MVYSCVKETEKVDEAVTLFELRSTIDFENTLVETETLNPYTYKNFYNGGGVALGDLNNDGLLDIYFTGNLVDNKLYLNKGNWEFEDITSSAGVACKDVWSSGVTFVDINADGLLDLYVCKAGPPSTQNNRHNELFINNGDLTFTERSKEFGLDLVGLAVQANFFDYDKDGDLDCYLLSNSIRAVGNYDFIKDQRNTPTATGNKFLRNDNGVFIDITEQAGIYSSAIGFGLGITVSDYNNDTWPDIFISNDFFERDYLYLNNQDGTFTESLETQFQSISMGSMGADAADLDNDSNMDIMVTEMLPKTIDRQRTKTLFESWNKYDMAVKKGYHHQFSRNALHRNMGDSSFLEISRFSGVAASEWSWASLLFDADNDGLKDIFISNGICKDLLDRDYLVYMANDDQIKEMIKNNDQVMNKLINLMPSQPVPNAAYKNLGGFQFADKSEEWGLAKPSFSNGSTYGDLDNDGDLDLVVNNVNMPAFVYENKTDTIQQKSISVILEGNALNTKAIGAKVEIFYGQEKYSVLENYPSRGFESSVSNHLLFGVGHISLVDSLFVTWPSGTRSRMNNLATNRTYNISENQYHFAAKGNKLTTPDFLREITPLFIFDHKENISVDFNREQLLPEMYNNEGPKITQADINYDGQEDFYIGGAKGQSGLLFLSENGNYKKITHPFDLHANSEDVDAVFFDSDADGDLDLYVASGGKSFSKFDFSLHDRLYVNDGNGNFSFKEDALSFKEPYSTATVSAYDYDHDGDEDLFIGERFKVDTYGIPASGYIMENKGNNVFIQKEVESLQNLGLITDAVWSDLNNDGTKDLIVVGEWMPVSIFINYDGKLVNQTAVYGLENSTGYWKRIAMADIDADGDIDMIVGNKGTNTFFKDGMRMYISDFDHNGTKEQIICHKMDEKYYPILDRDELIAQLPSLKQKLLYYKDYAKASIDDIFSKEQLQNSTILEINRVQTTLFLNNNNTFIPSKLPGEIQYSNTDAIAIVDVNNDQQLDILIGGNQYLVKPQFGRQDASQGWLVYGSDEKEFKKVVSLGIKGQIRDFCSSIMADKKYLIVAINNEQLRFYEMD